jgi:predicted component of type VI protein secretion system
VRCALSWLDGQQLRLNELSEQRASSIGREPGSTLDLSDPARHAWYGTVSRRHAEIRPASGGFLISHLSQTNPTRVNGVDVAADRPRQLSDRDVIGVGRLQLMFHDLLAADRWSGVICPSCQRENDVSRQDCWYDGTNLVSAVSIARRRQRVACRVIAADGSVADLFTDDGPAESLWILATGELEKRPGRQTDPSAAARISIEEQGPMLVASAVGVTLNGQTPPQHGEALKSADVVHAEGGHYLIMLR